MRTLATLLALPLVCLMLLVPPSVEATTGTRNVPATAKYATTPTDAQLNAVIGAKLAKSKIGKDGFRFHVSHGIVTWEGTTNVAQHKGSATRMARTAGALQVVNNIQVSAAGKAKAATSLKKASLVQ